ncbi:glycosyltransferase family 2 protein [Halodurantibacterium flavum]|uniref:Glycosyltransferase family 2 protein n=1 Tax=Halodurantibacterium flavum TaxID=1382802 RepID=A0ABW4S8M1_9RHOB
MTSDTVSVIVVSRGRPDHLRLCLISLLQQDHSGFEVLVVADAAGLDVAAQVLPKEGRLLLPCDIANISLARNIGIGAAAGRIIAYIDDDAVAEPSWLSRLVRPFADPDVAAAGGFVRGRNGISYQWQAQTVDATGAGAALSVPQGISVHRGAPGRAIKTEGTNCAFRRGDLLAMGGFDPAFAFYLDETDVNMRLAALGRMTAIVTDAEVIHGSAPGDRRGPGRVPRSLFDVGASSVIFLRKHAGARDHARAIERLRKEQRRRLLRLMVAGWLEPRDVRRLMHTLEAGMTAAAGRALEPTPPLAPAARDFAALGGTGPRPHHFVAGLARHRHRLEDRARTLRAGGALVTLLVLSLSPRLHRMRLRRDGIWEQSGGLISPSDRNQPPIRLWRVADRIRAERYRLAHLRSFFPA